MAGAIGASTKVKKSHVLYQELISAMKFALLRGAYKLLVVYIEAFSRNTSMVSWF